MKKIGIIIVGLLLFGLFQGVVADDDWWTSPRHDAANTAYSTSYAPNTNNTLWEFGLEDNTTYYAYASPIYVDGQLYVLGLLLESIYNETGYTKLFCINPDTGEEKWNLSYVETSSFELIYFEDNLYFSLNDTLVCINSETKNQEWSYQVDGIVYDISAVEHNKIYFKTRLYQENPEDSFYTNELYCLNAFTGDLIWDYESDYDYVVSPFAIADGRIYFSVCDKYGKNSSMYCLNAYNGNYLWKYSLKNVTESSPVVDDDKMYFTSHDGDLYCLNAINGDFIWNYTTQKEIGSSPAVAYNKVYFTSDQLYCLDADTGEKIWNHTSRTRSRTKNIQTNNMISILAEESTSYVNILSSPIVADGKVYLDFGVFIDPGVCWCFDAYTGDFIWNSSSTILPYAMGGLSLGNGKLYAPGFLYMVCFGDKPELEIGSITGGFKGISADISNIGSVDVEDVEWSIKVTGGIFEGINHYSTETLDSIGSFESASISTYGRIFGLGPADINITASAPGLNTAYKNMKGFVLGPYIFIL